MIRQVNAQTKGKIKVWSNEEQRDELSVLTITEESKCFSGMMMMMMIFGQNSRAATKPSTIQTSH